MPLVDPVTMSSALAKGSSSRSAAPSKNDMTAASQSTATATPLLHPIQIKPNPLAQSARHAFPALLAGLFVVRFRALVADPVWAMATTLMLSAVLQVAYAVICLPPAGSSQGGAARAARKPRPGEKKRVGFESAAGPNAIATSLLSLILSGLVTPFLYICLVLFGAPFLTHTAHTLLCAAHLSVLALFPLFYVHGVDAVSWAAVGGFSAPLDETFGGLVGALVGAWLGAVPIPLDWDRDWQKWPVTILCGLYAGYLLGRELGGSSLVWGKRF